MVHSQLTIVTSFYEVITLSREADQGVKSNNNNKNKTFIYRFGIWLKVTVKRFVMWQKSHSIRTFAFAWGPAKNSQIWLLLGNRTLLTSNGNLPKCPHSRWKTTWPVISVTNARSAKYLFYTVQCKFTFWGSISGKMESTCTCKKYLDLCTCASNC